MASEARADLVVREVSSAAKADCVIEWTEAPPRPGMWREVVGFTDLRVYFTEAHAELTVFAR